MSRKSKHIIFIEAEKVIRIREENFIKIILSSDGGIISTSHRRIIMDMIKDFLYSEMGIEELYKEVIFFINSDEIQKGEFEGNQYILQY